MENERLEFVRSTPWGRTLTPDQAARVAADLRYRDLARGQAVCHIGTTVQYWKGMVEGLIKLSVVSPDGRSSTLTGLAPGAWFGENAVLRSDTWDYDGVAMHDTRLALVPKATVLWLLSVSLPFSHYVIGQVNERLAQFLAVIEAERLETPETRVARCLAWLFNPVLYPNVGLRLALTQQEIGYLSGVPRQRVNRALGLMETAGLVVCRYGAVQVLNLDGLRRFRA